MIVKNYQRKPRFSHKLKKKWPPDMYKKFKWNKEYFLAKLKNLAMFIYWAYLLQEIIKRVAFLAFLAKPSTHIYFKIVANRLSLKKTLIQIYNQVIWRRLSRPYKILFFCTQTTLLKKWENNTQKVFKILNISQLRINANKSINFGH